MNILQQLLDEQRELDSYIAIRRNLDFDTNEWIRRKCTALICEASELLDEVNYKWWKQPKIDNQAAIKEEIVDIFHFFLGICNDAGLDAETLYKLYKEKKTENYNRQQGKSAKSGYEI